MLSMVRIIRRLDDLGRIVIPKELRRPLRVTEGDAMQICIKDGGIFLTKYSPVAELSDFAREYAESLYETTGYIAIITDKDRVITIAGAPKSPYVNKYFFELQDKELGDSIQEVLDDKNKMRGKPILLENSSFQRIICIISAEGDTIGTVVLLAQTAKTEMGNAELKIVETAANFLGKKMGDT
jgi:stage V sporulation protein T